MERRRRRHLLLLLLAVCWPAAAAAAAAAEACDDGDQHSAHPGCVDAAGLARHHGDVWRERAGRRSSGGCVRRVSACVAGRLLRPVPDRVERCPPAGRANQACRMESFFTCCPVYDCPSKLASLISPLSPGQDPSAPVVETFLSRVRVPELFDADSLPLPVARPHLNATAIRQLLGWLGSRSESPSAAEQAVRRELRDILAVLEATGPPPEPAGVQGALRLLRQLPIRRRLAAARLLRQLLGRLEQLQPPVTAQLLLRELVAAAGPDREDGSVEAGDVAAVATALFRLELDREETPIEELLRYIVLYGELESESDTERPQPGPQPDPDSRTVVADEECDELDEGLVWAMMEHTVNGRCTRHVRACRGGQVITSGSLRDREHVCDATGPELCRLESFFTCCPVYDCNEMLQRNKDMDPRFRTRDTLSPAEFERRVGEAAMASVRSPVPVVGRALHIDSLIEMRGVLTGGAPQERRVREELDQIVALFVAEDGPTATDRAREVLRQLAATMDDIGVRATLQGSAVSAGTVLDTLITVQRLTELQKALSDGPLAENALPSELPGSTARLLLAVTAAEPAVSLREDIQRLVLSTAAGQPASEQQLSALLEEAVRVLDVWLDSLPAAAFLELPQPAPLDPESPPGSMEQLLWLLLPGQDGSVPAPLSISALMHPDFYRTRLYFPMMVTWETSMRETRLMKAVVRLAERLRSTGRLRPALVRLVRQLARPSGSDYPDSVRLLLELVRRAAEDPAGLQPGLLGVALDVLAELDSENVSQQALQLLQQLVEGLTPQHRVVGPEVHGMLARLLQVLGSRLQPAVSPADLRLLVTAVRQLGKVTRRDVRPVILEQLVQLLGGSAAAADPAALQLLVGLISRLSETQAPSEEDAAVLRLLRQILETLASEPDGAAPGSVQLIIRLVEQLSRPQTDAAGAEVMKLILQLIEGLQRPSPQLGRQLVQLVVQLARRHGSAAPQLRQLMLVLLPLLSGHGPASSVPDGLLQVLLMMVESLTEGRSAQGGSSDLHELLLQLTTLLSAQQRPLPTPARKLLLEIFLGAQTGRVSDDDVMMLVLTLLELLSQAPEVPPTTTIGFNITAPTPPGLDPDVRDLRRLLELLFSRRLPDGRAAGADDLTGIVTVLLGERGSDSSDADYLLRLLLRLVEGEMSPPGVPSFNITAVLGGEEQGDFTDVLQLLELLLTRFDSSRPQDAGFVNMTGMIVGDETDNLEEIRMIVEMLLAGMSTMARRPSETGFFNFTLVNESPDQSDELRSLLEMILLEIEIMERNRQPTGFLNISTVVVDNTQRDYTRIRELLAMLITKLTSRTAAPHQPGFINISLVQDNSGFHNIRYLLELLMSQLRQDSVSQPQPGFLNISGVLVGPGRDDFGDLESLLRLILADLSASQTPDFPGFFNISGIMVNGRETDMVSLRAMLEAVMSRMSAGNMPAEELSVFRELIMRFFNRPSGPQEIDVQGIIEMLIELGQYDSEPTFSITDFIALIQSLDVPEDHPTFTDDIRRLIVLLREGSGSPSFLSDLTSVVMSLLQLMETTGHSAEVSPEMLIRFIIKETERPGEDLESLLTTLVDLLDRSVSPRRPPITVSVVAPPPDSLPASLRDLVLRLQLAVEQPQPLRQLLPQLLQLLTALAGSGGGAPEVLQFAAQLAAAALERAPDAGESMLVPQIQLQLRHLARQPRPERLAVVAGLLRRLLMLEQQRRPAQPDGPEISVTVITDTNNTTNTDLTELLRGLLSGGAAGAGSSSRLSDLIQRLLEALLVVEQGGGGLPPTDLLPKLVELLRLAVQPPTGAGHLSDDTLTYLTELTRAVLERLDRRADPLLPRLLLLLRQPGPRPGALRSVLAVLEQLLARQQQPAAGGGLPADLLQLLARLERVSERGRPGEYLPLVVTLLRRAGGPSGGADPALTTYLTELVRGLLRRDAGHLNPLLGPRILALISGGGERQPVSISELLPLLEMLVSSQTDVTNETGSGDLSDLFGPLTLGGRSSGGRSDAPPDFAAWLLELLGPGEQQETPEVSAELLSHLVHLLRLRDFRPDHDVPFTTPSEAARLLLLLSGGLEDPAAVSVSALDAVLSLLDPGLQLRPGDTPAGLLRALRLTVWGAVGRPDSLEPAVFYRRLLGLLTGRPVQLPASEAGLRRALLLFLAGPQAAQPGADTAEAARLLLTLLTQPADGGSELVPAAALRLLASLLEAAAAGGRPAQLPEPGLRYLLRLLTEPGWRGQQPPPEELLRLLAAVITGSPDSGRQGVPEVALRILLRLLGGPRVHRMIPIPGFLRGLMAPPDGRSGAGADSDPEDVLNVLMNLLSDPGNGVSGLPDDITTVILGSDDHRDHDESGDHGDGGDHHSGDHEGEGGPPAVPDSLYRLLAMMAGGAGSGDPPSPPRPLYLWLSSQLGEDDFDADLVPTSVFSDLAALLSAERFEEPGASEAGRLLAALGGGRQLQPERLFRRLLLLLARRGGLTAPPGQLLRRCRLLCDAAAAGGALESSHSTGVQTLPGRTPITFIGENHVIVLNG